MRVFLIILAAILILGFLFRAQIEAETKVILLATEEFGSPLRPLDWLSHSPTYRRVTFEGPSGPIDADLYLPRPLIGTPATGSEHAIIIALGVRVPRSAVPQIRRFAASLARLGYVTLWPRRRAFVAGRSPTELPSTFVRAFTYLSAQKVVDRRAISFFGLSVGASTAVVAASNPQIDRQVHALIFFAGDYNLFQYLVSLATEKDSYRGHEVPWHPSPDAIRQVKQILIAEHAPAISRIFSATTPAQARHILNAAPASERQRLRAFDPAAHIRQYHAPTFILDDTGDQYVPYVESEKLKAALPPGQVRGWLLTDLFQHVLPQVGNLPHLVPGLLRFNAFAYSAFRYL